MALADAIVAVQLSPSRNINRVELLLKKLEGTADHKVLMDSLADPYLPGAALTRAVRAEYGHDVVKDRSIDDWRRSNLRQVNGL